MNGICAGSFSPRKTNNGDNVIPHWMFSTATSPSLSNKLSKLLTHVLLLNVFVGLYFCFDRSWTEDLFRMVALVGMTDDVNG